MPWRARVSAAIRPAGPPPTMAARTVPEDAVAAEAGMGGERMARDAIVARRAAGAGPALRRRPPSARRRGLRPGPNIDAGEAPGCRRTQAGAAWAACPAMA